MNRSNDSYHQDNIRSRDDRSAERLDLEIPITDDAASQLRRSTDAQSGSKKNYAAADSIQGKDDSVMYTSSQKSASIDFIEARSNSENKQSTDMKRSQKQQSKQAFISETDFYRKPTVLSRLILNQKFGSAIRRVYAQPEESLVWVCARRASKSKRRSSTSATQTPAENTYSIRQLPIHFACGNLSRIHDLKMRKLLNELISTLIFSNPEGAHEADHKGKYPLHEAIWYGAAPDTIALFLMAKPSSISMKDRMGRSLTELNQHRRGLEKDAVNHLLSRGVDFWKKARKEANVRLKHNPATFPNESISSMSKIAAKAADIESVMTNYPEPSKNDPDEIPPISWDQLEKRSIATEQILTEINIQNYELSKKVEALKTVDEIQGREIKQELTRLNDENGALSDQLRGIENLLIKALTSGDEDQAQQYRLALAEISSLMGLSDKSSLATGSQRPVLSITRETNKMYKELSFAHTKQRERIRKMKHAVRELLIVNADESQVSDALSTISALTSLSAKSGSYSGSSINRTPSRNHPIDDLGLILRHAATRDQATRVVDQPLSQRTETEVPDDLSAMIRLASSKDTRGSRVSSQSPEVASKDTTEDRNSPRNPHHRDIKLPALLPKISRSRSDVNAVGMERTGFAFYPRHRSSRDAGRETSDV